MQSAVKEEQPEPWLRGPLLGVPAHVMPVFFSFAQVREDLQLYLIPLSAEQIWCRVGKGSIGFHVKHMAGSVDRLSSYLFGRQLSEEQLDQLRREHEGTEDAPVLLAMVDGAFGHVEQQLRGLPERELLAPRTVGRKELPTTVLGLLVHLAEHTQRHLGQVITLSKLLRQIP